MFHKDLNISTIALVKPLFLCVFPEKSEKVVKEESFGEWISLLFAATIFERLPVANCQPPVSSRSLLHAPSPMLPVTSPTAVLLEI